MLTSQAHLDCLCTLALWLPDVGVAKFLVSLKLKDFDIILRVRKFSLIHETTWVASFGGGFEALSPVQLWKWAVAVASFQQLSGNRTILVSHIAFVFALQWLLVALKDETYKATFPRNKWFT